MRKTSFSPFVVLLILIVSLPAGIGGEETLFESRPLLSPSRDILFPVWAAPLHEQLPPAPFDPDLMRALEEAGPRDRLRVILTLREQVDLSALPLDGRDRSLARAHVVASLQHTAARTQPPLLRYLDAAQAQGKVVSYTPFWIFNGVAVQASPDVIRDLATHPAVAGVRLDRYRQWVEAQASSVNTGSAVHNPQSVEWGVARVRVPEVWASLHVTGTGAVVAGMDTGVDWLHPALQVNYRGYNPHGAHNHVGNWFDAVSGSIYPHDDNGHGTHTLGTAVGQGGIGVAPGAQWIGVKVLSGGGYGYESWIHAGFQWLLAPGGDPSRAPDVVNCSWGNRNGQNTVFQADLQALRAASIVPVFSVGNNGPIQGTVGSPASLPEAFAIGAGDMYDGVANFSSRGPSPWGDTRPHIIAPGVDIRSSLPGGVYGLSNGTSMATPHVSGIVALLRSVSPTLSITRATSILTRTAVPLGDEIPNNDSGWGRVDAFAAVSSVVRPGFISGSVRRSDDGSPIAGATVVASPRSGLGSGWDVTRENGAYLLVLAPGTYDMSLSAFGYEPATVWGVQVITDEVSVRNPSLIPLPAGTLQGQVRDLSTGALITATVSVLDTPVEALTGTYAFSLPAGTYTIEARRLGYRVVTATAVITADHVTTLDFSLSSIPSILLVDSGQWYYDSQIDYYRQALDSLQYTYDEWPIRYLPDSVPIVDDLAPYDVVVWSAPLDAPGYIGAGRVISDYLSSGGHLFLSGQDVGYLDGGGTPYYYSSYYEEFLKAVYRWDNAGVRVLEGTRGELFAGLTITIAGPGGADNQSYPDVVDVLDPDVTVPLFTYADGGYGGIGVKHCRAYRSIYLSFGLEGINDRASRQEVLDRALNWLVAEPPAIGLELRPLVHSAVGLPGHTVTHSLRIRHVGQAGVTDTVQLSLQGADWPAEIDSLSLELPSCISDTVLLSVTIPAGTGWDMRDVMTLTARSTFSPALAHTAALTTKTPAPILLVDDDRWYDQQNTYRAAMQESELPYDVWETCSDSRQCRESSPSLKMLERYPVVVWWTGYDWYRPLTTGEVATVEDYLEGGGRLYLSSQDFLYYHHGSDFRRDFLGVLTYTEAVTPTWALGVPEDPVGDHAGPWELVYPFRNWSDGLVPMPGTGVSLRDENRHGIALTRREGEWATLFSAFPFEALPAEARPQGMERIVGWLSWLGTSAITADRASVVAGDTLTYTLRVYNDGPVTTTASLSNTLPAELTFVPGSLTGPATWDPGRRRFTWEDPLASGRGVTITYRVTVAQSLLPHTPITNPLRLGLEEQGVRFRRGSIVRVDAPDLSPSRLSFTPSPARPGAVVSGTLLLTNNGAADSLTATGVVSLPFQGHVLSGTLAWQGGGSAEATTDAIRWTGPLPAGSRVTLTWQLRLPAEWAYPLYGVAFLEDGLGGAWERPAWVRIEPWRGYLPVIGRYQ